MKAYTFSAAAAVTVSADTEAEARSLLACLDEDVTIGYASVYFAPYDLASADLVDVYDLDDE